MKLTKKERDILTEFDGTTIGSRVFNLPCGVPH